jgi:hypothetical protein
MDDRFSGVPPLDPMHGRIRMAIRMHTVNVGKHIVITNLEALVGTIDEIIREAVTDAHGEHTD